MILVFDTETNGLPKNWNSPVTDLDNWPRVVQLAWCLFDNDGSVVDERVVIIKPDGWVIPSAASDVHGITTEKAAQEGIPVIEALSSFLQCYEKAHTLVAHNIAFDRPVLGAEMLRANVRAKTIAGKSVCTMKATTLDAAFSRKYGQDRQHIECQGAGLFVPLAFDTKQITSAVNRSAVKPGEPCPTISAGSDICVAINVHQDPIVSEEHSGALGTNALSVCVFQHSIRVRRITPTEACRLQGFPDNYTAIYRHKTPDGPQYRALGNSMAVPVLRRLGERIEFINSLTYATP